MDLKTAISRFGADAKAKLNNPSVSGESEDQLRAPLETLFADLAELCGFKRQWLAAVGESSLADRHVFFVWVADENCIGSCNVLIRLPREFDRAAGSLPHAIEIFTYSFVEKRLRAL
jgi:hypothetical protein